MKLRKENQYQMLTGKKLSLRLKSNDFTSTDNLVHYIHCVDLCIEIGKSIEWSL